MKKRNLVKILSCFLAIMIFFIAISGIASSAQINYDLMIPLGAEVDLLAGLSDVQSAKFKNDYFVQAQAEGQVLENIKYNFLKSIDEDKYYAGAYWGGNNEEILYILVTDLQITPKINNRKIVFEEVQYSYADLIKFRDLILDECINSKVECGIAVDIINNCLEISINEEVVSINSRNFHSDNSLFGLVPEDSFILIYDSEKTYTPVASEIISNATRIHDPKIISNGSIACPIWFDEGSTSQRGWLTAGHVARQQGNPITYIPLNLSIGTVYWTQKSGNCDAAIIKRVNTANTTFISSSYIWGDLIRYQESTTAGVPTVGTWVDIGGYVTGAHFEQIEKVNCSEAVKQSDGTFCSVTDMVRVKMTDKNIKPITEGDSGGPVYMNSLSDETTIVGIVTSTLNLVGTDYAYYSRLKNIRGNYNISVGGFQ